MDALSACSCCRVCSLPLEAWVSQQQQAQQQPRRSQSPRTCCAALLTSCSSCRVQQQETGVMQPCLSLHWLWEAQQVRCSCHRFPPFGSLVLSEPCGPSVTWSCDCLLPRLRVSECTSLSFLAAAFCLARRVSVCLCDEFAGSLVVAAVMPFSSHPR